MLRLALPPDRETPLRVLCLGAHADDIEIGCGGTLLRLAAEIGDLAVRWVVFSGGAGERAAEARNSAAAMLSGARESRVDVLGFRDGYFPFVGAEIKDRFEALKREVEPALIFTHWTGDAHQDHKLVGELTLDTYRNHLILAYEIPKYDGDLGNPNVFVPLSEEQLRRKTEGLRRHFPSQHGRGWFRDDTFYAMARLRGIGCKAPSGLAEAFHAEKLVF
jgi:LmbE family N-acetylglucosaminyl deacetylase